MQKGSLHYSKQTILTIRTVDRVALALALSLGTTVLHTTTGQLFTECQKNCDIARRHCLVRIIRSQRHKGIPGHLHWDLPTFLFFCSLGSGKNRRGAHSNCESSTVRILHCANLPGTMFGLENIRHGPRLDNGAQLTLLDFVILV